MYKNKNRDFKNNSPETNYSDSAKCDQIDLRYGFKRISDNVKRTGYLINIHSIDFLDDDRRLRSALDLFFIQMDGTRFKYTVAYMPYFLICVQKRHAAEITQYLKNKFGSEIAEINEIEKEDLDLPNHLTGIKQPYIKLSFNNQNALTKVRKIVSFAIKKRKDMSEQAKSFASFENVQKRKEEPLDCIIDMREHDVPYHIRVSIDLKIFCGMWYDIQIVSKTKTAPDITPRNDIIERPEPVVLAFDIETTKLPLKFPDANFDQVMMISYMIDGQGYLITNREIISTDVNDFEYSPKPEFEGHFKVFNESNESNCIQRFFNHVIQIRPHIIVTYNGDFFDWPFIETRASMYGLNMSDEIGFLKSRDGVYVSRPSIHMDCLCWVKRDSYLPVGSHGLKAVAKAKLHYDPIELDPEEMCKMAVAQPQVLSNYSVSDAIATYYLYMKYVHPFVFALSTIIPMEPDEILRKGSGTLCETLLMVEAYHANIVYPNKQQTEKNMVSSDGLLIDSETYVGGHVEALECGVYRADIPCRFRLDRKMITHLMSNIDNVLEQAIVIEEGVPLDKVKNYNELAAEVKQALQGLYDIPYRLEQPVIYHLDVGAMYPNIILTNRLQPSAIVNDADCAACDFNCPDAKCKRPMKWQWRGEMLPASKNELYRIKQQLEMEKFPPLTAEGPPRSFHELSQEDQEAFEKKRLTDYCRKVYKKTKVVKLEERASTICQKENSFYVDTVRAFRDRRYEYKGLTKVAKRAISEAIKLGDAAEIKAAKSKEVLYDSLQLAHKCILNSFYGYVMRKGARWHSMPMAGIVCLTGSNIITKARIIIESIGRPLELDTDGIWCILPASFPQVLTVLSDHEKKASFNISYPNAVLNNMVKAEFTNDQYHELVKSPQGKDSSEYQIRSENSIFFEVDGPYLAMVLPAAKEEGKKLKKRYAVFNFDGSLAELKGFEVKRRGELQLIKNFQSSVFESFLSGSTLEECYNNVAKIANYWLDVLYSNGQNLPDKELFELVSENRSMSKKLEDYGTQKSTSISTARRLAEFLGDQMVKDAGLACKYVISRKPDGAPVTERAIPLAIFQCEPAIRRQYLRRWLRDSTVGDEDIRDVLDWGYYIERLSGAVQKIITIPAAMQGVSNPVPRVVHPDWLHKRMVESTCKLKQRQINEMFTCSTENKNQSKSSSPVRKNVENSNAKIDPPREVPKKRRLPVGNDKTRSNDWKQSLGPPPPIGEKRSDIIEWILYQKKKWLIQFNRRQENKRSSKRLRFDANNILVPVKKQTVSEFLRRSKKSILHELWHIVHLTPTDDKGNFVIWAMVESELHKIRISIPRIFYVHQKTETVAEINLSKKKSHCILPRSTTAHCIYKYTFQEKDFKCNGLNILGSVPLANIEGVYETNISLESRFLIEIGCLCSLKRTELRPTLNASGKEVDAYTFEQLEKHSNTSAYLENTWKKLKKIYLYQNSYMSSRQVWAIFLPSTKRAVIIVLDKVRSNQMPNINTLYAAERSAFLNKTFGTDVDNEILPKDMVFESFMEVDLVQVYRQVQRCLSKYKEQKKGPTLLCTQTLVDITDLKSVIPLLSDFPIIKVHISDDDSVLRGLGWQKLISRVMIRHFLNFNNVVDLMLEQSRYLNVPIGNLPSDPVLAGTDIFYARLLQKNNFILWWSASNRPDLGGKEAEDCKLLTELNEKVLITQNNSGFYSDICIALAVQNLAITALLQSNKIQEMDNVHSAISFDKHSQSFLKDTLFGGNAGTKIDYSWTPAFGIMRVMVNGWLREISQNKNVFSDYHIAHFYRWVRSSNSSMNDPGISKMLTNLMEKLFKGIMKEFTRLGVAIVFADLNTVIINSKKKTVNEAFNYIEFIIQSIRKNELYHSVQLIFDKLWINLVWLDSSNFAGMTGVVPQMESNRDFPSSEIISNEISSSPDIHFTLGPMTSGPSEFKVKFEEFAGLLVHSLLEKESAAEAVQHISHNIFCLVVELHKKYITENADAVKMFVETIIKVLRCHEALKTDIISLQRNLLKVIGATEFGKSIGSDVLDTFVLNGVTCKACNEWRDVDLMNDKLRTAKDGEKLYVCHRCHVAYEKREIEQLITEDITRRLTSFTLQDIKCLQCNAIKKDNFSENCVCGGNYAPLFKIKDARIKLDILLKISESNKMNLLHSTLLSIK